LINTAVLDKAISLRKNTRQNASLENWLSRSEDDSIGKERGLNGNFLFNNIRKLVDRSWQLNISMNTLYFRVMTMKPASTLTSSWKHVYNAYDGPNDSERKL
jgi:hypothetical protein